MKNIYITLNLLLLVSVLLFLPKSAFAAVNSYKLNDPFHVDAQSPSGRVVYFTSVQVEYKGGKMILSKDAEASLNANVGDTVQLWINHIENAGFMTYTYNANSADCKQHTNLGPADITQYFSRPGTYNITIRYINWCFGPMDIDSLYLVNTELPESGPNPFLDLPWDYKAKGLSFTDASLSITSYFDHEYPLLSAGLGEPIKDKIDSTVVTFKSLDRTGFLYSSHDGYDYAAKAQAFIGDPVLAAAAGEAVYVNLCKACGNMIEIDHGNGYQTRYMHMQKDGLITDVPGQKVHVEAGQQIGKVGATGNVNPAGDLGAHIHFMVVEDKDHDGNFDNNIPDGVTDPFGWQSKDPDPWANFSFSYLGQQKTGNKSYYLWKSKIVSSKGDIGSSGAFIKADRYTVQFPEGASGNGTFKMDSVPVSANNNLAPIGSGISATAFDLSGNAITTFAKAFTIAIDFSNLSLLNANLATLGIYSSQDGLNWVKENTTLDLEHKKASADVNHLTYFALMAEKKDTIAPTTEVQLEGEKGQDNWFRSDVKVNLNAKDNENGLGVAYTMYQLNDGEWEQFTMPLNFTTEGHYKLSFYSVDKDDNIEQIKTVEFDIDKTFPEALIEYQTAPLDIIFSPIEGSQSAHVEEKTIKKNKQQIKISDKAGNTLTINTREKERGQEARLNIESLQYNQNPVVTLPDNVFAISYAFNKNKADIKKFEQVYKMKDKLKLKLVYTLKTNKTAIITQEKSQEKVRDNVDGRKYLQLKTDKGTVKYSY